MFKIIAADKIAKEGLALLEEQTDAEVTNKPGITVEELCDAVKGHHGMVVRSGVKVTREVFEAADELKVVARAGVGVDNIDLEAATENGVLVINTAAASTITTAEHAFTLLMALARNVGQAHETMRKGGWDRSKYKGKQLHGLTLGVVGFGRIGQTMAERALAFGMNVVAFDPVFSADTALDGRVKLYRDFKEILPLCDALSFHVPLTDQTRGMLGGDTFPLCKDGVMVVNAARGGVIDEDAVIPALESGKVRGVALDVFSKEPLAEDSPLRNHPQILLTPHLGASTEEAQTAVSVEAARGVLRYLRGEGIEGAVNVRGLRVDLDDWQKAYLTLASRAGRLLAPMITRGMASIDITLAGEGLASAAGTFERSALVGLLSDLVDEPVNLINVVDVAKRRGIQVRTVTQEDAGAGGSYLAIEVTAPEGAVDSEAGSCDQTRRVVGRVLADNLPRITQVNGFACDIVPEGAMVVLQNEDKPGMVGKIGAAFADAGINIADLALARRADADASSALMILKLDQDTPADFLDALRGQDGVLRVCAVSLAGS